MYLPSVQEKLMAPTNLTISLVENNKIQINWVDNSTNETKFIIDRKKGIEDWFNNYNEVSENITVFNNIIQTNSNTIYSYRLKAFDGEVYSAYSNTIAWFSINSAPSNLQLKQIAQDSIRLNWQDNSIGEQGFKVNRKIDNEEWISEIGVTEANVTTWIDSAVGRKYNRIYYKLYAYYNTYNSDIIETSSISAPTNIKLKKADEGKIEITWTFQIPEHNYSDTLYFVVGKKIGAQGWNEGYENISTLFYTFLDNISTNDSLVYAYKIKFYNKSTGESSLFSDVVAYLSDCCNPTDLIIVQISQSQVKVMWQDHCVGEEGYYVDKKIGNGDWFNKYLILGESVTSFIDDVDLSENIHYRIYAFIGITTTPAIEASFPPYIVAPQYLTLQ